MDIPAKYNLLKEKSSKLSTHQACCKLCPRNCGVNRTGSQRGFCGADAHLQVYTAFNHLGEEPALSGIHGSGTIFFSGCNLKCVYCQNHVFSHRLCGTRLDTENAARLLLALQKRGAHNINFVTPTHFLPQILQSVLRAAEQGLTLPLVYNTSGYEKKEIIQDLRGIIDIYLCDFKYLEPATAARYSHARDYPQQATESILQMHAQSALRWNKNLLEGGLIIRHLVLPGHIDESKKILTWIKRHAPQALVSVMFQYQPYFQAYEHTAISHALDRSEYEEICTFVEDLELDGWIQDFLPQESLAGVHFQEGFAELLAPPDEKQQPPTALNEKATGYRA